MGQSDFGARRRCSLVAEPEGSLDFGQLIGLTMANVLIVVYFVVAACIGGRRSVHDDKEPL
jgi:hypothetical protein